MMLLTWKTDEKNANVNTSVSKQSDKNHCYIRANPRADWTFGTQIGGVEEESFSHWEMLSCSSWSREFSIEITISKVLTPEAINGISKSVWALDANRVSRWFLNDV